jgi:hypothetical protein
MGFIDHLQIVTTSNYSAISNSHTLQFTTARTKSSQFAFARRFLVTDSNSVLCLRPYWLANVSQLTKVRVRVKVTSQLAVYRKSVRLGDKPLETHDQDFLFPTEHLRL